MDHRKEFGKLLYQEPFSTFAFHKWVFQISAGLVIIIIVLAMAFTVIESNTMSDLLISLSYLGFFLILSFIILIVLGTSKRRLRIFENGIILPTCKTSVLKVFRTEKDFSVFRHEIEKAEIKQGPSIKGIFGKQFPNWEFNIYMKNGKIYTINSILPACNEPECFAALQGFMESLSHR